ncbi:hypothetical protein [Kitasatospora sp. NPDC051914]|uniref:hypothetical protein n=1 Tax=Kitasatospora sp. NPDC051914 TaxID=3154945 RepID=UPI0034328E67
MDRQFLTDGAYGDGVDTEGCSSCVVLRSENAGQAELIAVLTRRVEALELRLRLRLNREGIAVAWCTVERLTREPGLSGAVRGRKHRTTVPDPAAALPTW